MDDDDLDPALWTLLREQAADDRVPDEVRAAALASLGRRDDPAGPSILAVLVADTADESDAELASVRGSGTHRLLTFATESLTIELEVTTAGRGRTLVGQLVPPGPASISADHALGVVAGGADPLGRFHLAEVAPGPVRLRCVPAGGTATPVRTDWFLA